MNDKCPDDWPAGELLEFDQTIGPWDFDLTTGELQRFVNADDDAATEADFDADTKMFEECFARDVRFLHGHAHDHDCCGTCVKNRKKKTRSS